MTPEQSILGPNDAEFLTAATDRGDQRRLAKRVFGPGARLYDAKVEAAVHMGFRDFCDHIQALLDAPDSDSPLSEVVKGLSQMRSIHSVQLPADVTSLARLSG